MEWNQLNVQENTSLAVRLWDPRSCSSNLGRKIESTLLGIDDSRSLTAYKVTLKI